MADFKTSASSVVHSFLAMYLMLWNSLKTVFGGLYSGLRTLSTVYPPAKQFLTNLENTIHRLKTDPAACADLKLNPQHLLQEFWTPSTVLEGLGQISIAVPVSIVVLTTTSCVLLASLLVTCMFALCAAVCLPVGFCCATGYIIGNVTQQLFGWGVSVVSALGSSVRYAVSRMFRRGKSGDYTNFKGHTSHVTGYKTSSDVPEDNSPKISATVAFEKNQEDNVVH